MHMKRKLVAVAGVALGAGVMTAVVGTGLVAAQPQSAPQAMKPPMPPPAPVIDYAAIAEKVVGTAANVKEGEIVQVAGGPQDLALLEEIVVAVRKRGAYPLFTLDSENIAKKLVASFPEKYDAQLPKLDVELNKLVNVRIVLPAVRDPSIFNSLSAERRAKIAKAEAQADPGAIARKRNVRLVELGNGFAPSPARAKELGISEPELTKLFWEGINADYASVQAKCDALKATLSAGKELKITHANGTNLTVKLKGNKKMLTSDGVISDADIKAGGPGVQVWIPAGEVYFVPASSEGKVVDDRLLVEGKVVDGFTTDIKGGKSTSVSAKAGWDAVKARYDLAGAGKTELSVVDFGCNPAVKTTGKFESFVAAGTVTLFFGGNVWAGGTNKEPYGMNLFLPGMTVTLDGKPLIENGVLK